LSGRRLNKILHIWNNANFTQTLEFPSSPVVGQMIFLRSGKQGGSLTVSCPAGALLYPSNINTLTANGILSFVHPNIGTSQWCYIGDSKWLQMDSTPIPLVDTAAGTTALIIGGPNIVNGNIVLGAALGQGDISMGAAQTATGTTTIGSSVSTTTIQGKISYGGFIRAGNTDFIETTANYTITTTINREFFLVANTGTATVTFPTGVVGQIITVRNQTSGNISLVAQAGNFFFPSNSGTIAGFAPWTMPLGAAQRFYFYSTYWMGMN
jgi:hypothetical protein